MQPGENRADNRQYSCNRSEPSSQYRQHRTTDRARGTRPPSSVGVPAGHFVAPSRSISLGGWPVRKESPKMRSHCFSSKSTERVPCRSYVPVSPDHCPPSTVGGWTLAIGLTVHSICVVGGQTAVTNLTPRPIGRVIQDESWPFSNGRELVTGRNIG